MAPKAVAGRRNPIPGTAQVLLLVGGYTSPYAEGHPTCILERCEPAVIAAEVGGGMLSVRGHRLIRKADFS